MSQGDTNRLGAVTDNVYDMIKKKTTGDLSVSTELRAAQIIATGYVVAALINSDNDIYHDHS